MRGRRPKSDESVERTGYVSPVPYAECPAKSYQREDGTVVPGRSVLEHCSIVGHVARGLVERYPHGLRNSLFPDDSPFAAACHDIGKVSPCFVEKLRRNFHPDSHVLPPLNVNPKLEKQWGGHAGVSQASATAMGAPQWIPEILGQHHGFSPILSGRRADAEIFGGPAWEAQRQALVQDLKQRLGMDWPRMRSVAQARVVAGLTSVADWIGSGKYFENPALPWLPSVARALDEAGFIRPTFRSGLHFEEVFGFSPRPAQSLLVDAIAGPGVYVLEAPMGMGKTEAALYAAYRLLEQGDACGIYFALPTQLTSNKIYQRFNAFLQRILANHGSHRAGLLHAHAWLVESEMGEEGRPGGAWFNHAKRGLLAPFAVGTIDQALMAAMNVKHGFVRAFGLSGKVVILDEVHSYDAYTGTLLDALVHLLRSLHCTVIILSATLNRERRRKLVDSDLQGDGYPLITSAPRGGQVRELAVSTDGCTRVEIALRYETQRAVQEALDRAASGQQVLWIENSVQEAQDRFLDLAARATELGLECGLLHSRFNMADRQRIEAHWVDLFGKPGWGKRGETGRILVGTQVLEQSLDIDADFLVSRFAPTDMVLQRLGRLWRHADTPRPQGAICEAWLLVPQLTLAVDAPDTAFGASAYVYSPYVLCRSLQVWQTVRLLTLPHQIRELIERTYSDQEEHGAMARWQLELEEGTPRRKGRKALQRLARIGLSEGGRTLPESQAQTRYSEADNLEVLLLRDIQRLRDQDASRLTLLDGSEVIIPLRRQELSKTQWKEYTAALMRQIVPVRTSDAPQAIARDVLESYGLQHCFYLGDRIWEDDESMLRVALVDSKDALLTLQGGAAHARHRLEYRSDLGYRVVRQ